MDTSKKIPPSLISKLEQVKLYMAKRRVTAFIGAGFSLNAEMPSHVKMKTWVQLREDFLNKLYGDDEEAKKEDIIRRFHACYEETSAYNYVFEEGHLF